MSSNTLTTFSKSLIALIMSLILDQAREVTTATLSINGSMSTRSCMIALILSSFRKLHHSVIWRPSITLTIYLMTKKEIPCSSSYNKSQMINGSARKNSSQLQAQTLAKILQNGIARSTALKSKAFSMRRVRPSLSLS